MKIFYKFQSLLYRLVDYLDQMWPYVHYTKYEHLINLNFEYIEKIYKLENEIARLKAENKKCMTNTGGDLAGVVK